MIRDSKFILAVLVLINIFVYFPSFYHVARSEQNLFLYEVSDVNNLQDLMVKTYSYARSRTFAPGDHVLFRPLLYSFFSVQKLLFGYNFFYWQLVAVALHLIVVWQLYRILMSLIPSFFALLFALNFSLLHISQEMVIWHHMTPIVLQMALILTAFNHLISYVHSGQKEDQRIWKTVLYLTIASLIHEFALIISFIFMFMLFFYQERKEGHFLTRFKCIARLLIPVFIFGVLSLWDYWVRFGTPVLSAGTPFNILKTLENMGRMFWAAWIMPWLPCYLNIGLPSWSPSRLATHLSETAVTLGTGGWGGFLMNINFVLLVLFGAVFVIAWLARRPGKAERYQLFTVFTAVLLSLAYVAMIVMARINQAGFDYLDMNLFYLYPVILFNQIFIYYFFISALGNHFYKPILMYSLVLVLLLSVGLNGYKNFKTNMDVKRNSERLVRERIIDVESFYLFQKYAAQGDLFLFQGLLSQALENYNKALDVYPHSEYVYTNRGILYARKGRDDLALADYNRALQFNPSSSEAYKNRGVLYNQSGQTQLALDDFNRSLKINPDQASIYNDRGNIYNRQGQLESAIQDYNIALRYDPQMVDAYYNRGVAHLSLKEYDLALADFTKTVNMSPEYVQAYFQRAGIYFLKRNFDQALNDYNKLLTLRPNEGLLYVKRAEVFKALKEIKKASEDLLRAKSLGFN